MNETRKRFIDQVWMSIRSPRNCFKTVREEDLRKGLALVIIVAILSVLAALTYASKIPINTMPGIRGLGALYALKNGLNVITGWLLTSIIIHLLARILVGKGGFMRILAQTGFASTPLIIQQTVRILDAYIISENELSRLLGVRSLGQSLPLNFMSQLLALFTVFGFWTFMLTTIAVSNNYESSKTRSIALTSFSYLILAFMRIFLPI